MCATNYLELLCKKQWGQYGYNQYGNGQEKLKDTVVSDMYIIINLFHTFPRNLFVAVNLNIGLCSRVLTRYKKLKVEYKKQNDTIGSNNDDKI